MNMMKRILCVVMVLAMLVPMTAVLSSAAEICTVTFDANLGTDAPDNKYAAAGASVVIPAATPGRSGMVFRGWALSPEAAAMGDIAYSYNAANGGSSTITVTSDTTLYAVWAYTVTLKCGPEGTGSSYKVYKYPAIDLSLYHVKSKISSNYGLKPANGSSDQRTFIEWNTAYNSTTSRGSGTAYYDVYNVNANVTLYAIWGYNIQFNADGGTYPSTDNDEYLTYVASYNLSNQSDPKTDYSYCMPELFDNTPTKSGCRRVLSWERPSYALLNNDMTFFCWETPDQNLTIPPTGGYLPWSDFHCTESAKGTAPEFYAIWEPSVSYKPNGGSGSTRTEYLTWTGDALYDYEDYTVMSSSNANSYFSKDGATVIGWNTKRDGTGDSYSLGEKLTSFDNSDPIVLYAQWSDGSYNTKADTYTVKYNANGGTNAPTSQTKTDNVDLILATEVPERTGYEFLGWATANDATTAKYTAGATFTKNKNTVLYAVWSMHTEHDCETEVITEPGCDTAGTATYTCTVCGVSFDATLGKLPHTFSEWAPVGDGTQTRTCSTCGYTESCAVTFSITYLGIEGAELGEGTPTVHTYGVTTNLVSPTKVGYTFDGWYNERGTLVTQLTKTGYTEDITLTAKWTANSYKITYKDKGNSSFSGKMPDEYVKYHTYGTDSVLPVPAKTGYNFIGWHTDKNCTTEPVLVIGATERTAAFTLYAKWEIKKFNITYRDMGDEELSGVLSSSAPTVHTWGKNTTLKKPTKVGYSFGGWYLDPDCTGTKVSSLAKSSYNADITLYAKWTANSYSIKYKDEAGKTFSGKHASGYPKTHTYDTETVLLAPAKTGYIFKGWYLDKACTAKPVTTLGATDYTAAVTVYAKWQANTYTVTYRDMGDADFSGVHPSSTPTVHTYGKNTNLTKPTKTGYTFGGWYLNPECTGSKISSLAKGSYTQDITLYAKWTANKYTITYRDKGNGSFSGTNPTGSATKHTYDTDTVLPVPTKKGYTFVGWYLDRACATTPVTVLGGTEYTASIKLYAKWEVNVYTITYRDKGGEEFSGVLASGNPTTHTYNKATTLKNPTKEGYTFGGWYTDAACTKKVTSLGKTSYTADITLYAKWTAK